MEITVTYLAVRRLSGIPARYGCTLSERLQRPLRAVSLVQLKCPADVDDALLTLHCSRHSLAGEPEGLNPGRPESRMTLVSGI